MVQLFSSPLKLCTVRPPMRPLPAPPRSLLMKGWLLQLLCLAALCLLSSCGRSQSDEVPTTFPDGRGLLPHPEGAQNRLRLLGELKDQRALSARVDQLDGWSGYLLIGEEGAEVELTLTFEGAPAAQARFGLYGPRELYGQWSAAPRLVSASTSEGWRFQIPERGDYFLLPLTEGARPEVSLTLSVRCPRCGPPSCDSPGFCSLVCGEGFQRDDEGCVRCACASSCAQSCPEESLCEGGRCVPNCVSACPATREPVCGESGQTWPNACLARCAADSVQREGPCEGGDRRCDEANPCPPALSCVEGRCTSLDCDCPTGGSPVCSQGQQTFSNRCLLDCAGEELWQEGPCPEGSCSTNRECRAGRLCLPREGVENQRACLEELESCERVCRAVGVTACSPDQPCGAESGCSDPEGGLCLPRCLEGGRCPASMGCEAESGLCTLLCTPEGRCPSGSTCDPERGEEPLCWPTSNGR